MMMYDSASDKIWPNPSIVWSIDLEYGTVDRCPLGETLIKSWEIETA
jgi:hypothetical protein